MPALRTPERRRWLKDRLAEIVNDITDRGWGTDTDDGQRLLLEEAGRILIDLEPVSIETTF